MALETAKPQAAVGFGALAGVISQAVFALWPSLIGQTWVETAISLVLTLAAAAFGAWQARNKVTPAQIATAIKEGDVSPKTVATVAGNAPAPMPGGGSSTMKPILALLLACGLAAAVGGCAACESQSDNPFCLDT